MDNKTIFLRLMVMLRDNIDLNERLAKNIKGAFPRGRMDSTEWYNIEVMFTPEELHKEIVDLLADILANDPRVAEDGICRETVFDDIDEFIADEFHRKLFVNDVEIDVNVDNFYESVADKDFMRDEVTTYLAHEPMARLKNVEKVVLCDLKTCILRDVKVYSVSNESITLVRLDEEQIYKIPFNKDEQCFANEKYKVLEPYRKILTEA